MMNRYTIRTIRDHELRPGSPEASLWNCECPTIDNREGYGFRGVEGLYIVFDTCPLHRAIPTPAEIERRAS